MVLFLTITAMAVAGAIHFSIVPAQYQHAPAHGIFFGLAGASQLFWSFAYWRRKTAKLAFVGIALSGGMIFLWLLTRMAAPFEQDPHAIGWAALTAQASEIAAFISLVTVVLKNRPELFGRAISVAPVLAAALVITLSSGVVAWGGGHLTETMYPEIGHEGDHDSAHDHGPGQTDGDGHVHSDEQSGTGPVMEGMSSDPNNEQGGIGDVMEGMSSDPEHEEDQGSSHDLGS